MSNGYANNSQLPPSIRFVLPVEAQTVFRIAYNNAVAASKQRWAATDDAWAAVKVGWNHEGDKWVRKSTSSAA